MTNSQNQNASKHILVLGAGGREHALAWKIQQSPLVKKVWVYPGNPGIKRDANLNVVNQDLSHQDQIKDFCQQHLIDLIVVGPETYLAQGIVDFLAFHGFLVFGPTQAAAELETSKHFAKMVMQNAVVPTAAFHYAANKNELKKILDQWPNGHDERGLVIKVDGLAAGKGVFVCPTPHEVSLALDIIQNGEAVYDGSFIVEELLVGQEVSAFYLCQDDQALELTNACDYKRLLDHDLGPNTGGMGAYAPAPWLSPADRLSIKESIVLPVLREMKKINRPFRGVLFVGLMMTKKGARVLEFNVRFGDPETQAIMPLIQQDFFPYLQAVAQGALAQLPNDSLIAANLHSVHIVATAQGYPGLYAPIKKGDVIQINEVSDQHKQNIFFAGVSEDVNRQLITQGGRVLGVTAVSDQSLSAARASAYASIKNISFVGMHYRQDIAQIVSRKKRVIIFASGDGSNAETLIRYFQDHPIVSIVGVMTDQENAGVIARCRKLNTQIQLIAFNGKKTEHEQQILQLLKSWSIDWIVLAGYMRLLSKNFIQEYFDHSLNQTRIINIHPSLLPRFPGKNAYQQAFESGDQVSGITIHYVDAGMDTGKVIVQKSFVRNGNDTFEDFKTRGLSLEHQLYPVYVEKVVTKEWMGDLHV
jgi:phosphoribosylamine--glycine ligase